MGVDRQQTRRLSFVGGEGERGGQLTVKSEKVCREVEICRWGGRGGEFNQQSSQRGSAERLKFAGGEGGGVN